MWAFGFDTAHCTDSLEKWPKEAVMAETMRLKDQIDDPEVIAKWMGDYVNEYQEKLDHWTQKRRAWHKLTGV